MGKYAHANNRLRDLDPAVVQVVFSLTHGLLVRKLPAVLVQLTVKRSLPNPEHARGLELVIVGDFQRIQDGLLFHLR